MPGIVGSSDDPKKISRLVLTRPHSGKLCPGIRFRKNDQGMVHLANLFKVTNSDDRIDPVTGSFGSMEDENNRDRIRQISGYKQPVTRSSNRCVKSVFIRGS